MVRRYAEQAGGPLRPFGTPAEGREGALELTDAKIDACNEQVDFKYLYPAEMPLRQRVELIAREVYGAEGVTWTPEAAAKAARLEAYPAMAGFSTMMVKTHLSLSHDPNLKKVFPGAGCCRCGTSWSMPGLVSSARLRATSA